MLVAFKRPSFFIYFDFCCRLMDILAANISTDQYKIHLQGKMSHYLEVYLKNLHYCNIVNCDSLVFQTGADIQLKVHFLLCVRAY